MKKFIFLLVAFVLTATLFAQQGKFKVLAVKGEVKYAKSERGPWEPLSLKTELNENTIIKLESDNYVGLIHQSGKTLELKNKGKFKVAELSKDVEKKPANITKRLTAYLIEEVNQYDDMMSSKNYRRNMQETGAVERSVEIFNDYSTEESSMELLIESHAIELISPRKSNVLNGKITFSWEPDPNIKEYKFCLHDRFDREVYNTTTQSTSITIDLNELNLERDVYYFWNVYDKNNPLAKSFDCAFLILDDMEAAKIQNDLKNIYSELEWSDSPMNNLVLAAYFNEHSLYFNALEHYQRAMTKAPDIDDFKKFYELFRFKISSLY